jgi:O-antigen/teichoic acid export membrane protein
LALSNPPQETHDEELSHAEVRSRAARGALSGFTRHAVVRMMALVGTLVLARLISPAGFGLFATGQFVLSALAAVCVGGVITTLVRQRAAVAQADLATAFSIQQALAVLSLVVTWFAAPLIVDGYDLPAGDVWVIRAMSAIVLLQSLKSIPIAVLQRRIRHDLVAVGEIVEYLVYVVTALLLAWAGWGVWALVTATALRYLIGLIVLHVLADVRPHVGFDWARTVQLLRFAVPLQITALLDVAGRAAAPLIVGALFNVSAVGVIGMANTMLDAVVMQPITLLSQLQLRLFARIQDDNAQTRRLLSQCFYVGGAALTPITVGLACLAPFIIGLLLPAEWAQVGPMIQGLFVSSMMLIVAFPVSQAAKALGLISTSVWSSALKLAVQLVVLLAFYKIIGLNAYPLAITLGSIAGYGIVFFRVRRRVGGIPLGSLVPVLTAGLAAGAIWWAAGLSKDLLVVLGGVALGAIVYVAVLVLLSGREVSRYLRLAADATLAKRPLLLNGAGRLAVLIDRAQLVGRPAA